jgi:acetolactate synthase-1/2/3 large subunit
VLVLPKDIQQSMVGVNGYDKRNERGVDWPGSLIGDPHPIVRALRSGNGPVTIIAGDQVARDDARAEQETLRAMLRARDLANVKRCHCQRAADRNSTMAAARPRRELPRG